MDRLQFSEEYEGHTIYYAPARRRWLVDLEPGKPMADFNAAFQARRAIKMKLSGESESWPMRQA